LWADTIIGSISHDAQGRPFRNWTDYSHQSFSSVDMSKGPVPERFVLPPSEQGFFKATYTTDPIYYWISAACYSPVTGYVFVAANTIVNGTTIGYDIITIRNPVADPNSWSYFTARIPYAPVPGFYMSSALTASNGYIYLMGYDFTGHVLVRQSEAQLGIGNFVGSEWLCNGAQQWCMDAPSRAHIFSLVRPINGATIMYHAWMRKWVIMCLEALDERVFLAHADQLEGPYQVDHVYSVPAPWNDTTRIWAYMAMSHPEYVLGGAPNRIIFSYSTDYANGAMDPKRYDLTTYVPRFVQLDIAV